MVVDNGPEFRSTYFETLLARYECTKKTRPGGKPRFGSVCERLFGTSNTEFVHNLVGNTQITRRVREMTKAVNPKRHARWSLGPLYGRLCEWAYEVYDMLEHSALGQSPYDAFTLGLVHSGQRGHRLTPEDLEGVVQSEARTLVVGTGARGLMRVPQETLDFLDRRGFEVLVQKTGEACQTYNRLSERGEVIAALHLSC